MPKRGSGLEDKQEAVERGDGDAARKLKPDEYTIGWICAIKVEYVAAQELLDEEHEGPEPENLSPQDNNNYALGSIGMHNVVIATLPLGEYGTASAATVARDMMHSFQNVRIGLMVGIGGGAPSEHHDIRLGDIVVSSPKDGNSGLLQYDFGKNIQDQEFLATGFLNQPPVALRTALAALQAQYERKGHRIEETVNDVLEKNMRLRRQYKRPDQSSDRLYQPGVVHPNTKEGCTLACNPSGLISRPERAEDEDNPAIHYGLIASANQLMKNALLRDKLAAEKDVLCFEMEAAGLMNHFPCLIIRGICDYSDSHKNKVWQGYAAMVAAAFAKDLLSRLAPNSVTAEKRIIEILSDVHETVNGMERDVHKLIHKQYNQEYQAILDWLSPIDYAPQHNDFISRKQEGTGQWFLESTEFQAWLKTNGQTLFCPGIPGAGKTIITAIVVNHLFTKLRHNPDIGIAYIYFNFRQQDDQTAEKLLMNLLKQLVQAQASLPQTIKDLYDIHEKSRTRPSLDEITAKLHSMVAAYSRTFIVIDALDECQDLSRLRLLDEIFNLQAKTGANIFATSRINDIIRRRFNGSAIVEISADERDVLAYLDGQMSLRRLDIINDDIQGKIRVAVLKAAGGMFLLATFHIDTIMSQPTRGEIKEVLQRLGRGVEGLHDIYKQAMERIEGHTDAIRSLAKRILTWITHAKRPLSITEMQHALAVREFMTTFDSDYMPDVKDLKSVCAGLVTTDEESGIIRLVHYTAQEFFLKTREEWFPGAEAFIAKTCITYLSFKAFDNGICQTEEIFEQRLRSNPLYHYAALNWGYHARKASTISREVMHFLKCKVKVEASSQVLMITRSRKFTARSLHVRRKMTGLHLAAYFRIKRAVDYLLQKGYRPDARDTDGRTPLSWAAENGSVGITTKLLATGRVEADSNNNWNNTPLFYAVSNNHGRVVKLLLEAGVNVNSKNGHYMRTPLRQAVANGNTAIVGLLLENGAMVDQKDNDGITPLVSAVMKTNDEIVQLLLDHGADANIKLRGNLGRTPLLLAATRYVLPLPLDKGADPEPMDNGLRRSLILPAAENRHVATVQLLLDKGANVESMDMHGRIPLSYAAENGYTAIVQLLLDHGAGIDSKGGFTQTPLSYAARNGHIAVVQLLLDKGADFLLNDIHGRTPLSNAAEGGHAAIVELLLDKGADFMSTDVRGRTPLSYAAEKGDTTIVQLLLDKGADFNSMDEELKPTPLLLSRPMVKVDRPLIQRILCSLKGSGLDKMLNDNSRGRTPLLWAAMNEHEAIVQLLLDKGADVDAKDSYGRTPLSYAAVKGHNAIVQLLLDKGSDVDLKDRDERTPLSYAAKQGHKDVVKLLLDNGADIESMDGWGTDTAVIHNII
ncbi:Ankyrin repeat domain-containing protein 50 [Trichoderma lentiforme]|uniref:Ankyrin repeat domain-containing protein 50 n=1 Tax=Trichoderma lentiforme TaxID=1567552 RepID=A0A9P5CF20_9HYPO|nr:Ankyrin repeat domain-containing protein 50 [Trichoderma lentiforme]